MEKKTIYAVVCYPKRINRFNVHYFDFRLYTKQTSNLEKMKAYFEEIKDKHGDWCHVHLVTREKAKELQKKWYDRYCSDAGSITLEELDRRLNNIYAKNAIYC